MELYCNLSREIVISTCGMESELAAFIGSPPGSLSVALVALQLKPRRITARKPKVTPSALIRLIRSPNINRPANATTKTEPPIATGNTTCPGTPESSALAVTRRDLFREFSHENFGYFLELVPAFVVFRCPGPMG